MNKDFEANLKELVNGVKDVSPHHIGHKEPVVTETKNLPRQVELTCSVFENQFRATADRCDKLAEGLQIIVDELQQRATRLREQATVLPEQMQFWVRKERDDSEFAAYYEPLIK